MVASPKGRWRYCSKSQGTARQQCLRPWEKKTRMATNGGARWCLNAKAASTTKWGDVSCKASPVGQQIAKEASPKGRWVAMAASPKTTRQEAVDREETRGTGAMAASPKMARQEAFGREKKKGEGQSEPRWQVPIEWQGQSKVAPQQYICQR